MALDKSNLLGAICAIIFYTLAIAIFMLRLLGKPQAGYWIGIAEFLLFIPLVYLLIKAPAMERSAIYYIQIGVALLWLIMELMLDYVFKIDFRNIQWLLICYIIIFFAAGGGFIGIASLAGRAWSIVSIALFLVSFLLAFIQRAITGI